jgi:hypothetical protein
MQLKFMLFEIATQQDLQGITGYVSWLCFAMGWPAFIATTILQRSVYWARYWITSGLIHNPRQLQPQLRSIRLYTDATPYSTAAMTPGPPRLAMVQRYTDPRLLAYAEMAAAIQGLHWIFSHLQQPTMVTLLTDSTIVYYTLVKGTGKTLRQSLRLQNLYCTMWKIKIQAGHCLITRWVPSADNLADPLSRGVHAS